MVRNGLPGLSQVEEELYTHEFLWRASSSLLSHAETQDKGSFHFLLPSLLMSFLAYEAFVNFCGFVILPDLWKDEKKHFKGKGIEGKLKRIIAELPGFVWRKGEPPYQRIRRLEAFRDAVAHGKVIAKQYVAERKEDGTHFQFRYPWEEYLAIDVVKVARDDIRVFCQLLLVELRKKSDHLHLTFDAFEGSLATGTSASKRK